jgi:adenine-specific DNA-methyltransferase
MTQNPPASTTTAATAELGLSPDAQAQRRAELLALLSQTVPEVMADQQVNIDRLKELLGQVRIAADEHYELSWAGKAAARREIQKSTTHTLQPAESNPAQAGHMLIEGENLEVLRVLQKSYYGKVKMIYIDPPYNTGNDSFVYPDDYSETLDAYQKRTGEKNEAGHLNKQSLWKKNSKESGQYHSAWLSMMYPRLYLSRNLLQEDGVIFISIDENEVANLRIIGCEIFGEENYCGEIVWKNSSKNDQSYISIQHEYILCFVKSKNSNLGNWREKKEGTEEIYKAFDLLFKKHGKNWGEIHAEAMLWYRQFPESNPISSSKHYSWMDERGVYFAADISGPNFGQYRYDVTHPVTGRICKAPASGWRFPEETIKQRISEGLVHFGPDEKTIPNNKTYLKNTEFQSLTSVKYKDGRVASKRLGTLLGGDIFTNPKDTEILQTLLKAAEVQQDEVVLDFFAGSGSTTHAVIELNFEDGGNRQCISVQMPEVIATSSEAYKAGFRTIADITRARIGKVITKLKAEHPDKTADLACAHFTLVPSNFQVWRGNVADADALRDQLALFQSAEKKNKAANGENPQTAMLAELLLKHGLGALGVHAISKPKVLAGVTVHRVLMPDDKQLWLCFEPYTEALKDEIVKAQPAQVTLLSSCFVGEKADELLANLQLELAGLDIGLTVI